MPDPVMQVIAKEQMLAVADTLERKNAEIERYRRLLRAARPFIANAADDEETDLFDTKANAAMQEARELLEAIDALDPMPKIPLYEP